MRLDGSIPFDSIGDETRPVVQWDTHRSVQTFVDKELRDLFAGYYRDLLQSQPNHVELLIEKNTVASSLRSIAAKYRLPMTSGRGYSSLPPRKEMVDRFRNGGREKLVVVVVTDCDPEGFDIPNSFGLSLRDDSEHPATCESRQVHKGMWEQATFGRAMGDKFEKDRPTKGMFRNKTIYKGVRIRESGDES